MEVLLYMMVLLCSLSNFSFIIISFFCSALFAIYLSSRSLICSSFSLLFYLVCSEFQLIEFFSDLFLYMFSISLFGVLLRSSTVVKSSKYLYDHYFILNQAYFLSVSFSSLAVSPPHPI